MNLPPSPQCSVPASYARLHYALGGGGKETKTTTNILPKVPNSFQDLTPLPFLHSAFPPSFFLLNSLPPPRVRLTIAPLSSLPPPRVAVAARQRSENNGASAPARTPRAARPVTEY